MDRQSPPVEQPESTHPHCPRCDGPVYDPGIWVVRGADLCGKDCAANYGGHL